MNKYRFILFLAVLFSSLLNAGDNGQRITSEKDARHSIKNYIGTYFSILDTLPKDHEPNQSTYEELKETAFQFAKHDHIKNLSAEEIEKFDNDYYPKLMSFLEGLKLDEEDAELLDWALESHQQIDIQLKIIRGDEEKESVVDLKSFMTHLHAHYAPQFRAQNTTLKLEPFDQSMSIKIVVLESELLAALTNILTNSLSMGLEGSTRDGGETSAFIGVEISKAAEPDEKYLCFIVRDAGPGFSPTSKRKAFKREFTERQKTQGTGQGLSQVKAFAEKHGGAACVDNVLDETGLVKGAKVTMSIVVKYQD